MKQDMFNKETKRHIRTNEIFPTWEHFSPNVGLIPFQQRNACGLCAFCS